MAIYTLSFTAQEIDNRLSTVGDLASKFVDGKITGTYIAENAISSSKIASGAVSSDYTATITAVGWTGDAAPYANAVTVTGITVADQPIIDFVPSETFSTAEAEIESWGYVYRAVTSANTVTFYATDKPSVDLSVQMKVVRK